MKIMQEHFIECIRQADTLDTTEQEELIQLCLRLPTSALKQLNSTFTAEPDFIPVFYYNLKQKQILLQANDHEGLKELVREEESYCEDRESMFSAAA